MMMAVAMSLTMRGDVEHDDGREDQGKGNKHETVSSDSIRGKN